MIGACTWDAFDPSGPPTCFYSALSPPPLPIPPQKPDDMVDRSLNRIKKWCLARCSGPDEDELLGEALDADK